MRPDTEAFLDVRATPATDLAGVVWGHRDHSLTGACCLVVEYGTELCPPSITNGLGEMMILHHVGHLQVLDIDRVVLAQQV